MIFKPLLQVGGLTDTIADVIKVFGSVYFDTPRKTVNVMPGDKPMTATFQVANGWRTYKIEPTAPSAQHAFLVSVSGFKN